MQAPLFKVSYNKSLQKSFRLEISRKLANPITVMFFLHVYFKQN